MLTDVHNDCRENVETQLTTVTVRYSSHTLATRLNSADKTSSELSARQTANRYQKSTKTRLLFLFYFFLPHLREPDSRPIYKAIRTMGVSARSTGRPSGDGVEGRLATNGAYRISTARPFFTAFPAAVHMSGVLITRPKSCQLIHCVLVRVQAVH